VTAGSVLGWVVRGFGLLWLLALALFAFGLFGSEPDPLAGVFLIPLGLPWNRLLGGVSENLLPWVGALAPGINLALLAWLARRLNRA
jgi:hypothetical protein